MLSLLSLCDAQKKNQQKSGWGKDESLHTKSCSNLTQVLDNWKFAIMSQVKDLLVNDHATVLPEYSRIQPLSEALGDLYMQFNSLKEELGRLSAKFETVEGFVDDLPARKLCPPSSQMRTPPRRPVLRVASQFPQRTIIRADMRTPDRRNGTGPEPGRFTRTRGRRLLKTKD
ncbi:hypothetical protein DPEC_G00308060 [Dallia pectoralis]|uniref:Uncharacterized protein n=1 Tax=Dallia pectoralis TaxID=75939 RepID=A0ACC2FEX3_DALPE|nr:hypothetical protein DPEC_G00308060 [Dallia pectoralis]